MHACRPDLALGAPGLVDVPADRERRALRLDRLEDRLAAEVVAGARLVAVALRRGVDDQHRALRAVGQLLRGLVLVEVEAPVPGRDRDPGSEAEEPRAVDLRRPRRGGRSPRPIPRRRRAARPRSRCCRAPGRSARAIGCQRVDRLLEALVDRGEVAGGDHDVGVARSARRAAAAWPRSRCRSLKASSFKVRRLSRGSRLSSARRMVSSSSSASTQLVALGQLSGSAPPRFRPGRPLGPSSAETSPEVAGSQLQLERLVDRHEGARHLRPPDATTTPPMWAPPRIMRWPMPESLTAPRALTLYAPGAVLAGHLARRGRRRRGLASGAGDQPGHLLERERRCASAAAGPRRPGRSRSCRCGRPAARPPARRSTAAKPAARAASAAASNRGLARSWRPKATSLPGRWIRIVGGSSPAATRCRIVRETAVLSSGRSGNE